MRGLSFSDAVGPCDVLFVTLDTLRYDVAAELAATGRTPNLARVLPGGAWQRRHTPGSFTFPAHQAFFAGFLPTPVTPGRHLRPFAAAFAGSATTDDGTWVFEAPDVVTGLAEAGYHTVCVGGVGFFTGRTRLAGVLPGLFAESHWAPEFGVTNQSCLQDQLDRVGTVVTALPHEQPLFLFLNVAALHQPNHHYLPGSTEDTRETHAAALEYVDGQLPRLFSLVTSRGRPCYAIVCSDHGTAYGEDGYTGHRLAHEVVWTVPYAEFVLEPGQW